jgi:hypothetical protein
MSAPNPSTPEATRPTPFDLPLQRGDYGDDILDNAGRLTVNLYGDGRDPKTDAQRDYVLRAVNSYDDMLSALKAMTAIVKAVIKDRDDGGPYHSLPGFGGRTITENLHHSLAAIAKAERGQ